MDQLMGLRVFREVVESGSFALAADRLGVSPPMVSKRLAQLERSVHVRLLHRTSRHLSLTEAGSLYYEQCCQALDILDAAEGLLGQSAEGVRGLLKVSAPVWCANAQFAEALAQYHRLYPEVMVDMRLENRKVDLAADGYDLALRVTPEPSQALIARPLCQVPFHLVASPALARQLARSAEPGQTPVIPAIVPSYVDLKALAFKGHGGKVPFRLNPVMRSDDSTLMYHAVRAGLGAAFLPEWLVAADLAARRLVLAAGEVTLPPATMYAVYTSRKYMAPKLRTFIDFLCDALGPAGGRAKKGPEAGQAA